MKTLSPQNLGAPVFFEGDGDPTETQNIPLGARYLNRTGGVWWTFESEGWIVDKNDPIIPPTPPDLSPYALKDGSNADAGFVEAIGAARPELAGADAAAWTQWALGGNNVILNQGVLGITASGNIPYDETWGTPYSLPRGCVSFEMNGTLQGPGESLPNPSPETRSYVVTASYPSVTAVDSVIYYLDIYGGEGGILDLTGCVAPTDMTRVLNLFNKGWTINVTGGLPPALQGYIAIPSDGSYDATLGRYCRSNGINPSATGLDIKDQTATVVFAQGYDLGLLVTWPNTNLVEDISVTNSGYATTYDGTVYFLRS